MLLAGKRLVPWILHRVGHMGSRELFRLCVLAIALGVAYAASAVFGISVALGALFAGLIMAESELSQQAANETLPLRDAFAVLFFVSVGMLFDPRVLLGNPWPLIATVGIVVVFRSIVSFGLLRAFGKSGESAAMVTGALTKPYPSGDVDVSVIFYPPDRRRRDLDNCYSMCKAYQDGIFQALGLDDSRIRTVTLRFGRPRDRGYVAFYVMEAEE
jgi:CPA2 family monovalent cation:H+ antiporter-2